MRECRPAVGVFVTSAHDVDGAATAMRATRAVDPGIPFLVLLDLYDRDSVVRLVEAGAESCLWLWETPPALFRAQLRLLIAARRRRADVLACGPVQLHRRARRVTIRGVAARLHPAGISMLEALISRTDEPVSARALYEAHHGKGRFDQTKRHCVTQAISQIRVALGGEGGRISAIRGRGYRIAR